MLGAGVVESVPLPLLPKVPQGQGQLHMPPAPALPGEVPVLLGVPSVVGEASVPLVALLPRAGSEVCAPTAGLPVNKNVDNTALT